MVEQPHGVEGSVVTIERDVGFRKNVYDNVVSKSFLTFAVDGNISCNQA